MNLLICNLCRFTLLGDGMKSKMVLSIYRTTAKIRLLSFTTLCQKDQRYCSFSNFGCHLNTSLTDDIPSPGRYRLLISCFFFYERGTVMDMTLFLLMLCTRLTTLAESVIHVTPTVKQSKYFKIQLLRCNMISFFTTYDSMLIVQC